MSLIDLPQINLLVQVIITVKKKIQKKYHQQHVFAIKFSSLNKKHHFKEENNGRIMT